MAFTLNKNIISTFFQIFKKKENTTKYKLFKERFSTRQSLEKFIKENEENGIEYIKTEQEWEECLLKAKAIKKILSNS